MGKRTKRFIDKQNSKNTGRPGSPKRGGKVKILKKKTKNKPWPPSA